MKMNNTLRAVLIASTSLTWGSIAHGQGADFETDCTLVNGVLPENCVQNNASEVVVVPNGENNELDRGTVNTGGDGFLISIDGAPIIGDKRVEDEVRKTDVALANADVQVKFDGLGAVPRLDLIAVDQREAFKTGDVVTFRSRTNYPCLLYTSPSPRDRG